jgi:hypothetical protein
LKPFDERAYSWKGKGSDLVNLMLVEWFGDAAERITAAQVHRLAWEAAEPVRKHIRLEEMGTPDGMSGPAVSREATN